MRRRLNRRIGDGRGDRFRTTASHESANGILLAMQVRRLVSVLHNGYAADHLHPNGPGFHGFVYLGTSSRQSTGK